MKDSDRYALLILRERKDGEEEDFGCSVTVFVLTDSRAGELSAALLLKAASRRRRALSKLWFSVKAKTIITLTPRIS